MGIPDIYYLILLIPSILFYHIFLSRLYHLFLLQMPMLPSIHSHTLQIEHQMLFVLPYIYIEQFLLLDKASLYLPINSFLALIHNQLLNHPPLSIHMFYLHTAKQQHYYKALWMLDIYVVYQMHSV